LLPPPTQHHSFFRNFNPLSFKFELTLAPVSNIVDFSSNTPEATYKITNLELEYASIHNEYLAEEAAASYQVGRGFF